MTDPKLSAFRERLIAGIQQADAGELADGAGAEAVVDAFAEAMLVVEAERRAAPPSSAWERVADPAEFTSDARAYLDRLADD